MNLLRSYLNRVYKRSVYALFCSVLVALFIAFVPAQNTYAQEEMGLVDVRAAVNIVRFVRGLKSNNGSVFFGVLYDETSDVGLETANRIIGYVEQATNDNTRIKIVPQSVSIQSLSTVKELSVLFIPPNMSGYSGLINEYSKRNRVFNIGLDKPCVEQGMCIVSVVKTGSNIDVFVSYDTLLELGFDVEAAFKYMATKIDR